MTDTISPEPVFTTEQTFALSAWMDTVIPERPYAPESVRFKVQEMRRLLMATCTALTENPHITFHEVYYKYYGLGGVSQRTAQYHLSTIRCRMPYVTHPTSPVNIQQLMSLFNVFVCDMYTGGDDE